MNSEQPKSPDAMNIDPSDPGDLNPDAGSDIDANATDLKDSSDDFDHVDTPIPEPSGGTSQNKAFDSQKEMIRRLGG